MISWTKRSGKELNTANSSHLEINQQHQTVNKIQHCWEGGTGAQRPSLLGARPAPWPRLVLAKDRKADNRSHQAQKNALNPLQLSDMLLSRVPFKEGCSSSIALHWSVWNTPALEAHVCNLPFQVMSCQDQAPQNSPPTPNLPPPLTPNDHSLSHKLSNLPGLLCLSSGYNTCQFTRLPVLRLSYYAPMR